jgi:hypothetical protein
MSNMPLRRAGMTLLALSVASVHLVSASVPQSTSDKDATLQVVNSLSELRAVTPAEKARAQHYNFPWLPPLIESKAMFMNPGLAVLPDPPVHGLPDPDADIRRLVCRSTGIVYGTVQKSRVLLNKDETFLFTDYSVHVAQWVKPERGKPEILVSMNGGAARVGTTVLRAETSQTVLRDKTQLFFLLAIPKGDAYQSLGSPRVVSEGKLVGSIVGDEGPRDAQKVAEKLRTVQKQCKERQVSRH